MYTFDFGCMSTVYLDCFVCLGMPEHCIQL
jgi:hypothetical protein